MKILVTGGVGFIGSALASRVFAEKHEVIVLDNFNDYYDPRLKRARQKALLGGVEVVDGDITDEAKLRALFAAHKFDLVCHLAAQAGVRYSLQCPEVYLETNVRGTQLLLEIMKEFSVNRMVMASTSSVYGTDTPIPFTEDSAADRPVSIYAATKRSAELIAHTYYALYKIETTCLRFFTVYGPWSRPDMAMLKFAKLMKAGEPIDVYNHGDLRRDFTYVDDIVDGFVLAVDKPLGFEILNLGAGKPTELIKYIELLEQSLGYKAEKNMLPMQPGDVFETYADITKAKELLNFEAKISIEDGVKNFADWFLAYHK
jgi:UDP-glucuronate 4-epimerase